MKDADKLREYTAQGARLVFTMEHEGRLWRLLRKGAQAYAYTVNEDGGEVVEDFGELDLVEHAEVWRAFLPALVGGFKAALDKGRGTDNAEA